MLQYDNESPLLIIFRLAGSVLPQSCLLGLFTLTVGVVLAILRKRKQTIEIFREENYLLTDEFFKIACTVVGFLLVMRTNQALNRWMHAVTQVEVMLSKWADAYNALNSFFSGKDGSRDVLERILLFRIRVAHWFSLMSCLAFATLKTGNVNNLAEIVIRPKYPDSHSLLKTSFSRSYEGLEGILHEGKRQKKAPPAFQVLHAPTEEEVAVLEGCSDKVNIIALWIVQGIMLEVRDKTLDAPPPIVTRVFQEISKGMLGFHQAHKVAMVPFPFPFAQMVTMLLTLLYMAFPFFIDNFTQHVIITPIISFIIPVCYCSLNMLAVDLEVPFGTSLNCIDIMVFNQAFLDLLEDVLLQPQVPPTSEFARLEREIIQGIEFSKPREDPVPLEGAALVPAASFARTPDPLASAAVMPVASWNMPRAAPPVKLGPADRLQSPASKENRVSGPRAAAQYHAQRRSSPAPPASERVSENRVSFKVGATAEPETSGGRVSTAAKTQAGVRTSGRAAGVTDSADHGQPATDEREFKKVDGYIPAGGDLQRAKMTVADAKLRCLQLPGCKGFTFRGADVNHPVDIIFKSKADWHPGAWTTYLYTGAPQVADTGAPKVEEAPASPGSVVLESGADDKQETAQAKSDDKQETAQENISEAQDPPSTRKANGRSSTHSSDSHSSYIIDLAQPVGRARGKF